MMLSFAWLFLVAYRRDAFIVGLVLASFSIPAFWVHSLYALRRHLLIDALQMREFGRIFLPQVAIFFVWQCERSCEGCNSPSCSKRRVPEPDTQLLVSGA